MPSPSTRSTRASTDLHRRTVRDVDFLVHRRLERRGVLAAFTERTGGLSEPPFDSLNLSLATGDDSSRVRANRERVAEALGTGAFALGQQVHGARSARVGRTRAGAGFADRNDALPGTDSLSTAARGVSLAVLTADCVPVVLADRARVAVAHVGWRGLVAGIVRRALGAFADPAAVTAVLGPAIGPCHYEVGPEVALAAASATGSGARTERRGGALYLDLPATVAGALRDLGVRAPEAAGICTACERERFFSHRRDGPATGRQAAIVMRL
ncbi:MAG TPA: polyphenol oxidase family protein [Actinomycetota bacterium]|nr:polyphenol oxidase family protein [Actinomycetota bacterium]